jgi:hypothetical protein
MRYQVLETINVADAPGNVYELWAERTHTLYAVEKVLQTLCEKIDADYLWWYEKKVEREIPGQCEAGNTQRTTILCRPWSAARFSG